MVAAVTATRAAQIRAGLDHPVIDADGHFVELAPVLDDALIASLETQGGARLRDRYLASRAAPFDTSTVLAGRSVTALEEWKAMPSWWGWQTTEHPGPGHRAPPCPALRAPRRDGHRLLDPLSVDDLGPHRHR